MNDFSFETERAMKPIADYMEYENVQSFSKLLTKALIKLIYNSALIKMAQAEYFKPETTLHYKNQSRE